MIFKKEKFGYKIEYDEVNGKYILNGKPYEFEDLPEAAKLFIKVVEEVERKKSSETKEAIGFKQKEVKDSLEIKVEAKQDANQEVKVVNLDEWMNKKKSNNKK